MTNNPADSLKTNSFGLRFLNPSVEAGYREWRITTTVSYVRVALIAALLNWSIYLVLIAWIVPQSYDATLLPVIGIAIPAVLFVMACSFVEVARRIIMPAIAISTLISGLTAAWQIHEVIDVDNAIGLMSTINVLTLFFGFTVTRMPPRMAILSGLPYCALVLYLLYSDYQAQTVPLSSFAIYTTVQCMAFMNGILISMALEVVTRRTYCNHRTIHAQQDHLKISQNQIRRYIPPAVAEQIIGGNEAAIAKPERQRVTVLFSDIVGFTDMADRLDAESLTQILNEYMSTMAEIVDSHSGTLNEFAGDGLMAIFGAPKALSPEDQVLNAVNAAQKMQSRLPELNNGWRKLGIGEPLQIRVGINTGVLSVGSFGSDGRMTYTAIGLQTNIAARIESKAAPGEILISDASYQLISDRMECEPRGDVECKGVHFPVKVYAPIGRTGA